MTKLPTVHKKHQSTKIFGYTIQYTSIKTNQINFHNHADGFPYNFRDYYQHEKI